MGTLKTTITRRTVPGGGKKLFPNIVSFKSIGNDDLIERMMQNSGINKVVAIAAAAALRQVFTNYVLNGHTVQIPQLGTFSLSARTKSVTDKDKAGPSCIKAIRIRFTPAGTTMQAAKSVKFSSLVEDDTLNME